MPTPQDLLGFFNQPDMARDILTQRFQPTAQDIGNSAVSTIMGGYTPPQQMADNRLSGMMQIMSNLEKMKMMQFEMMKFDEQVRHDRATEGLNPQGQPITTGPTIGGGQPNMNPMMPNLVQTESGGNPNALSPKGAAGAFQIMPATAANPGFGVTPLRWWDGKDPRTAPQMEQQRFANDYLNAMQSQNGGNPRLAAAAYNAGPGAVARSGGDISQLPQETQTYVDKVAPQDVPMLNGQPRLQPSSGVKPFMPLFRGNEIMKDNLPPNFAYLPTPEGGIKAQQIPGTIEKGANGEILQTDAAGNITQQIPQNPVMRAKLESNLQKIADRFNELRKIGGTVEDITENNPVAALGAWSTNKATQLAASEGLDIGGTTVIPGGQTLLQGTKANTLRGEIRDLIKQTTPLYMQAMGITPGMERAVAAQQMLQDALGGAVGKSRQQNMYSLGNLSAQAGTGVLAQAHEAIAAGADPDAVYARMRKMQQ